MPEQYKIHIEHNISPAKLEVLGVNDWPIWTKEVSEFPWQYQQTEHCFILAGRFIVTPDGGEPVECQRGDYVIFPAGMKCHWKILEDVEKHYKFD